MLADVYVLAPERSAALVGSFLGRFLPHREPAAAEYEIPQYASSPEVVFNNAAELIRVCEARHNLRHAIYWNHRDLAGEPRAAHVFFLSDGGMVLGLSTADSEPTRWDQLLAELKEFTGSRIGYLTVETPPADSIAEFTRRAVGQLRGHPQT
jgi:hypothetical protein